MNAEEFVKALRELHLADSTMEAVKADLASMLMNVEGEHVFVREVFEILCSG